MGVRLESISREEQGPELQGLARSKPAAGSPGRLQKTECGGWSGCNLERVGSQGSMK